MRRLAFTALLLTWIALIIFFTVGSQWWFQAAVVLALTALGLVLLYLVDRGRS